MSETLGIATYSPEDDKLRFYPDSRLSTEDYARAKTAGFRWAPMQKLFFAMWGIKAEDLLIEWCGEIGDEDKSLVERQEERAERFEDYSDSRKDDAERAHKAVSAIADNIPLGQPILVGHHSERHARKDAEKIENGMRKAVKMWETSQYWKDRAAGALAHAKYKELPAVRARRIKTLESELRRTISKYTPVTTKDRPEPMRMMQQRWNAERDAPEVMHVYVGAHGRGGYWVPEESLAATKKSYARYEDHLMHRLEYEHAMLEEQGATKLLDKKPKSAAAQLPLCNYRAPEGLDIPNQWHRGEMLHYAQVEMTQAEYAKIYHDYKGTRVVHNSHRVRTAVIRSAHVCVFLTDSKQHTPPESVALSAPKMPSIEQMQKETERLRRANEAREAAKVESAPFDALREQLRTGVKVVSTPQLFPTPQEIAKKVIQYAGIEAGQTVLEPSAGTGALVREIVESVDTEIVGYEINRDLCSHLSRTFPSYRLQARCADFLEVTDGIGQFPRVVMNPPFKNGEDIKHIKHAMRFLAPGGRLVAICANGPRQQEQLMSIATHWEALPAGSFAEQGTHVNAAICVIEA